MIKTPVSVGIATINSMTGWCNVRTIVDVNMSPINNSNEELVEAEKRINMHDELVKSLRDMFEMAGMAHYNSNWSERYLAAEKLLERCK